MSEQYQRISSEEISKAGQHDPQRALLMVLANAALAEAEKKATGEKLHEPMFHEAGWSIAIETPKGIVGLWSCWLKDRFYLGYPKPAHRFLESLDHELVVAMAVRYFQTHRDKFFGWVTEDHFAAYDEALLTLKGLKQPAIARLLDEFHLLSGNADKIRGFVVPDELIMETLGVDYAQPVLQVDAIAVDDWNYRGEFKDPDKPLVKNNVGQIIAYSTRGFRRWAKFYGPGISGGKGRVWVDHSDFHSESSHFSVITANGELTDIYYGHNFSMGIYTERSNSYNEYAPDGPTTDPKAIQPYRDKFLRLACEIARRIGGASAVTIDYGFVLVPEQLSQLGYGDIAWLKGKAGVRQGWGNEMVRAGKDTELGKEMIILKSGNSLVPWSTIRAIRWAQRIPDLNAEQLLRLLTF